MHKFLAIVLLFTSVSGFGQNAPIDELWKLYNAQAYKTAVDKATALLQKEPNNVDLNLVIGRSYADLEEFEAAIPYLESAVTNDKHNTWRKAWALNYLGTCYFMAQDYKKAESSLHECIKQHATKNATQNAYGQTLLFGFDAFFKSWKIVETDNFRFHFQSMPAAEMEAYMARREKALIEINGFFKSTLPKKIDFFVWDSREDAKRILRAHLGFARPNKCLVHAYFQQTIGHEMTHVISNYCTHVANKTGLINEGTAVCFDQTNRDKEQIVKDWLKANNKKITMIELWTNFGAYPDTLSYPLSGLFVKTLIDNFGRDRFVEFFGNQSYANAQLLFGEKLDKVIEVFENKINT